MDSKDDGKIPQPLCTRGFGYLDSQSVKSAIVVPPNNPFPWARAATTNNTSGGLAVDGGNCNSVKKRCDGCKKKVGLMGFWCRCGGVYCGTHRYPEQHSCQFDFKTAGRIALANQNILCKCDKLTNRI